MNDSLRSEMPERARILVVDDESHAREVVSLALEVGGFEVLTAMDGREGLERTLQEAPDLVLTDIHMPRMDGDELAREIARHMGDEAPPVIGFTADRDLVASLRAQKVFQAAIRKPVSPSALIELVKACLAGEPPEEFR